MGIIERVRNFFPAAPNHYIGVNLPNRSRLSKEAVKQGPLVGYKSILLEYHDEKIYFQSPTYKTLNKVMETSQCNAVDGVYQGGLLPIARKHKENFGSKCTCGFYSFKDRDKAFGYLNQDASIVVKTVISGNFAEYSYGYRAEKQRISEIFVNGCVYCPIGASNPATAFSMSQNSRTAIYPVCSNHYYPNLFQLVLFEEIGEMLAVPEDYKFALPTVSSIAGAEPLTRAMLNEIEEEKRLARIEREKQKKNEDRIKLLVLSAPMTLGLVAVVSQLLMFGSSR